jgi:hypothetical protein
LVRQLRRPRSGEDAAPAAHTALTSLPEIGTRTVGLLSVLGIGPGTELLIPPLRI